MKNSQFGVDYYPEHWDKTRWPIDLSMMQEMGIDVVRLTEFSWSELEPSDGRFSFAWLDEVLDLCERYGLKVVLGTPTAAPPAWLIEAMPDIQPMASDGSRRYFGGRHHDCQSHPGYRQKITRYVTAFAQHFGHRECVIGWQIDNELGNSHGDLCYCEHCEQRFRQWLETKYSTIAALNENWGTTFWSQGYQSFAEIHAPKNTASGHNPSQLLDWKIFHSDLINDFHSLQAKIIRTASPNRFITHNCMGFSDVVSYYDLAEQLDFVSHDQYLEGYWKDFVKDRAVKENHQQAIFPAAELDFIRSIKKDNFWVMEQQASVTGWEILGPTPRPGQIALWSMQSVAHGADTIVYFRWRSCPMGTEQFWHGILPHSGIPGRSYYEIKDLIQKVKPLMQEIHGTLPQAKVAIVYSYEQNYAFQIQPHHPELRYVDHLMTFYKELHQRHIAVDFVQELEDWSGYDLVIDPLSYLMGPDQESHCRDYVKNGGKLVMTMRTGVKSRNDLCLIDQALPGNLSDLLGVKIHDYDCLRSSEVKLAYQGKSYQGSKWADILSPTTAQTLATYHSEFYAGQAAITVNTYGTGQAYYVGTELDCEMMHEFIELFADEITRLPQSPAGVEIVSRESEARRYYFVLNHRAETVTLDLPENWQAYFDDQKKELPAYSYQVYYEEKAYDK